MYLGYECTLLDYIRAQYKICPVASVTVSPGDFEQVYQEASRLNLVGMDETVTKNQGIFELRLDPRKFTVDVVVVSGNHVKDWMGVVSHES